MHTRTAKSHCVGGGVGGRGVGKRVRGVGGRGDETRGRLQWNVGDTLRLHRQCRRLVCPLSPPKFLTSTNFNLLAAASMAAPHSSTPSPSQIATFLLATFGFDSRVTWMWSWSAEAEVSSLVLRINREKNSTPASGPTSTGKLSSGKKRSIYDGRLWRRPEM